MVGELIKYVVVYVFFIKADLISFIGLTAFEGVQSRIRARTQVGTPCHASLAAVSQPKLNATRYIGSFSNLSLNPFIFDF